MTTTSLTTTTTTTYQFPAPIRALAFSPDGKWIAAAAGRVVYLKKLGCDGQPIELRGHTAAVNSVSWSPNGRRIVTGGDDFTVCEWSVQLRRRQGAEEGEGAVTVARRRLQSHVLDGPVTRVQYSPQGQRFLAVSGRIVHVFGGMLSPAHDTLVLDATFSPDGSRVATITAGGSFHIWHIHLSALCGGSLTMCVERLNPLSVTWNQRGVVIGTDSGAVNLYRSSNGDLLASCQVGGGAPITALAWGPSLSNGWGEGNTFALAGERTISVVGKGRSPARMLADQHVPVGALALSRDGKLLAASSAQEVFLHTFSPHGVQ